MNALVDNRTQWWCDSVKSACKDESSREIYEWASDHINLPAVITRRGRFSVAASRHFVAPLQALRSELVREVNVLAPVRGGKTLIADVAVPWAVAVRYSSVLWVFQEDTIASSHAETRQWPILEACGPVQKLMPGDRHKKRKSEILFSHGVPLILTGPAVSQLQSRGFRWVVCDEPWLYAPGILGQAKARLGDFVRINASKFLCISQGGSPDGDWALQEQSGTRYEWHVPCMGCGELFVPRWSQIREDGSRCGMRFDAERDGDGYNIQRAIDTMRVECPTCGHEHFDTARTKAFWNEGGCYPEFVAGEDRAVTFRWSALIDYPWAELVNEWLQAQVAKRVGNVQPLINFLNKRLAEHADENRIHTEDRPMVRVSVPTDPKEPALPGEAARIMTVDRQADDLYWITVRAWTKSGESLRLWFGRKYSEPDIEAVREQFGVPPDCVLIDSGYRPRGDHGVYAACIRYGWIAVKGAEERSFRHQIKKGPHRGKVVVRPWAPVSWGDPGEGTSDQGRRRCPLFRFSSDMMADRVVALIERGLWKEPDADPKDEMEREYRTQMASEFRKPKKDKFSGRTVMVWVCPSGNNHAFDCAKMQAFGALKLGLIPSGVEMHEQGREDA